MQHPELIWDLLESFTPVCVPSVRLATWLFIGIFRRIVCMEVECSPISCNIWVVLVRV